MLRRLLIIVISLSVVAAWYLSLPPSTRLVSARVDGLPAPVRGAMHVHTNRSDGTGTVEDVATAAARAGLQFVIVTDHGDGTGEPREPSYHGNVLVIDAVEVSTQGGHVVALGLPASPYPLGGETRDVIEDITRMGGFAIAAHPESARDDLRWVEWTAPFGGLEWLNGDSEWRDELRWLLARSLFTYPARPTPTLAALLDRPDTLLRRWDVLTARRQVVAVAAADAHARLGARSLGEPYQNSAFVRVPSYEQMFRTFSIALPGLTLTGNAAADARAVIHAIRRGHVYSAVDGIAGPSALRFTGMSGQSAVMMGDVLPEQTATLQVRAQAPDDARIDLLLDGSVVSSGSGTALEHRADRPGAYRVEVFLPGSPGQPPVPWLLSNPIYVGRPVKSEPLPDPRKPATEFTAVYENGAAADWMVETSAASKGAFEVVPSVGGTQLSLRYALGGALSQSPFVALAAPAGPAIGGYDRLVFTARSRDPMRLSVQFRMPGGEQGQRWHRSVFLDSTPRTITIHFEDMTPTGPTERRRPTISEVRSLLWVVDTVNTPLGGSGEVWIDDVKYGR